MKKTGLTHEFIVNRIKKDIDKLPPDKSIQHLRLASDVTRLTQAKLSLDTGADTVLIAGFLNPNKGTSGENRDVMTLEDTSRPEDDGSNSGDPAE